MDVHKAIDKTTFKAKKGGCLSPALLFVFEACLNDDYDK